MLRLLSFCLLVAVFACGPKPLSTAQLSETPAAEWGDTTPIKTTCFALDRRVENAILVDYDDQAPVRLCAHLQADNSLAFELRYRPEGRVSRPVVTSLKITNAKGESAQATFPLHFHALTQSFELYISQGCILSRLDGCAQSSSPEMRALFSPIRNEEGALTFEPFSIEISFPKRWDRPSADQASDGSSTYRALIPAL